MNVEVLRDLIKKCDIYFEDQLISGELLLRVFTDFLSEEADRQENKGSIILHTASPCFDAIAVAWSALAVIAGNGADVESIIRMLQPGERVLCGKERGEFIGIETDENGKEWAVIRQGKSSIRKIGRKGWSGIIPYYGNSTRCDGREYAVEIVYGKNFCPFCLTVIRKTSRPSRMLPSLSSWIVPKPIVT
mgnify:CR=1 FL=1